jgi:hypothetical protein
MKGRPTLKASNSEDKITLPGRLQLFRGTMTRNVRGDVIGLDSEEVEIPAPFKSIDCWFPSGKTGNILRFHRSRSKRFSSKNNATIRRYRELSNTLSASLRKLRTTWSNACAPMCRVGKKF